MTFLRLIRSYARGDYRQVPWETVTLVVAAVLYFLMPIDVIPDVLIGVGFVDDAAVIAWVMNTVGLNSESSVSGKPRVRSPPVTDETSATKKPLR